MPEIIEFASKLRSLALDHISAILVLSVVSPRLGSRKGLVDEERYALICSKSQKQKLEKPSVSDSSDIRAQSELDKFNNKKRNQVSPDLSESNLSIVDECCGDDQLFQLALFSHLASLLFIDVM
ncbi:hypothetical protein LguiA_006614 [Lonicera macranthoides]